MKKQMNKDEAETLETHTYTKWSVLTNLHIRAISFNLTQLMSVSYSTSHCFLSFFPAVTLQAQFLYFSSWRHLSKGRMQKQIIELSLKKWQVAIWSSVCCIYTFLQTAWYICIRDFLFVWQCLSVSWCATVLSKCAKCSKHNYYYTVEFYHCRHPSSHVHCSPEIL